jgi:hypothetical protein
MAAQMERRSSSFPAASIKKSGRFRWLEAGPTEVWQSDRLRRIYTPENLQIFPGRKDNRRAFELVDAALEGVFRAPGGLR